MLRAYEEMGVGMAWSRFRQANGVPDANTFRQRIVKFAERRSGGPIDLSDPRIGCMLLDRCIFLPEEHMVRPEDLDLSFPKEVVKYKRFFETPDLADRIGATEGSEDFELVDPSEADWSTRRAKKRFSQSVFRSMVFRAYRHECALSGETCSAVLEASHIQPFYSPSSNHPQNGLCLRVDLHRLFDAGLISFSDRYEVLVSSSVDSDSVKKLEGLRLVVPSNPTWHPSRKALAFHRDRIFRL